MTDLNAAFEEHLASLPDADWRALVARVRPPTDPATARAAIGVKAAQLLAVPRTADGSPAGGWTAAVAARAQQPQQPPEQPTAR
jgi:hypothetical protein